jgi:hypothetical protein
MAAVLGTLTNALGTAEATLDKFDRTANAKQDVLYNFILGKRGRH